MAKEDGYRDRIELLQGTLDLLVLRTLVWGPRHGYAIAQEIWTLSNEALQVETGSLYPALHRMERQGLLTSEWKMTEMNQRTKHYSLTVEGRKQLAQKQEKWERFVAAMAGVLQA